MTILATVLIWIVALEAFFIMGLEMFGTQTALARQAFALDERYLKQKEAQVSMANQGLYNGFLGAGLLIGHYAFPVNAQFAATVLFLSFVVIAACYGALTANKKIIISQGLPAIAALIVVLLAH